MNYPRCLLALVTLFTACSVTAQPSGGPYGPQVARYEVPATGHVVYVAVDGKPESDGATLEAPTTLAKAVERCVTGDVLVLRGGVYRLGGLVVNQGVTLQPYLDERPVLKGTEVVGGWESLREGLWRAKWTTLFPKKPESWWRRNREGMRTPLHKFNNDMVFFDGRPLQSAGWEGELDKDTYSIDYDGGYVFIRNDPTGHVVEMTAHDSALVRTTADVHGKASDHRGYTLKGLTFTQYAYRALEVEGHEPEGPETEAQFGKDVVGTTLEDCTITHCSRVAGYFRGDKFVMRRCLVSDTSTEGIYILASSDCLLEKNIFARNNVEKITGYYPSAVKIFNQTHRVVCRDNLVIDQANSNGIWYDVGNVGGVFVNNWVEDCQDGFFYEISHDAICAGNVFVNCDKGVRSLNSAGVRVYQNTFYDSVASFERTERSAVGDHFGWHPATGPGVEQRERHEFSGNLLLASSHFSKALLRTEQAAVLNDKLTKQALALCDGNLYVRAPDVAAKPLLQWAPGLGSGNQTDVADLDTLRAAFPQYEAHSAVLVQDPASFVKSPTLRRFEVLRAPAVHTTLPVDVATLLNWTTGTATPGAFQVR